MHLAFPAAASADPADASAAAGTTGAFDPLAAAERLAERLAATAVERDRAGGHAAEERGWIRDSGLLALSVPAEFGGIGADWQTVYRAVRIVARADSALAHLLAFHHLQLAGIRLYGSAQQQRRLLTLTVEQRLFWGNALNPLDRRLVAVPTAGGYALSGVKNFASGSVGSDWLTVSAWDTLAGAALIGVLPTRQPGIEVVADWDAFGQRQTDSGNVRFADVLLPEDLVLQPATRAPSAQATLRSQVAQLVLVNLYLGIAEGALAAARRYLLEEARPWPAGGAEAAADDPFVQHRFGEFHLLVRPAQALADEAARALDAAFAQGGALSAAERGAVAVAVAEAKVLAHRAALGIGNQLFELTGARSTSARYGLDRFWRNARVHTLHDPVDYKLRDLGRFALDGRLPEPTPYS
ncbi:monooxygenase [Massilia forsythiae]|uniref:Monooxygenase n=1 Tax=Massilia forsythiae TaxID=2728020 RepID=A0A7Z2W0Y9_9BURK|nr:acyl-CoA dehydrogenase family protein [Massilia forsythiae]QJE02437.1 monooxygenase [Massilia forsythiae]